MKLLYDPELANEILAELAEGRTLRAICKEAGRPSEATVRGWAVEDREGFAARFDRAREQGCHAIADDLLEIADQATDSDSAAVARVRSDNRKWLLARRMPRVYGDRVALDHSITTSVAADLIEARRRVALLDAPDDHADQAHHTPKVADETEGGG